MSRRSCASSIALVGLFVVASGGPSAAHELRRSESNWRFTEAGAQVAVSMPVREVAGRTAEAIQAWFSLGPGSRGAGNRCEVSTPRIVRRRGVVQVRWSWRCEVAPEPVVHLAVGELSAGHLHAARVVTRDGRFEDALLTLEQPMADLRRSPAPSWAEFVGIGAWHVAGGLDHVAFVLALMLLGGSLWAVAGIATGFTIGHSITLGLAATGLVAVDEVVVEGLVAVSVAYAALACFHVWLPRRRRWQVAAVTVGLHGLALPALGPVAALGSLVATSCHLGVQDRRGDGVIPRVVLAVLFGLVHGFAFAGAFGGLLAGGDLLVALLGFNVGVELAQLLVIAAAVAVLRAAGRLGVQDLPVWTAAGVLAVGVAWTVSRSGVW